MAELSREQALEEALKKIEKSLVKALSCVWEMK